MAPYFFIDMEIYNDLSDTVQDEFDKWLQDEQLAELGIASLTWRLGDNFITAETVAETKLSDLQARVLDIVPSHWGTIDIENSPPAAALERREDNE